jgi:hypothetical protein
MVAKNRSRGDWSRGGGSTIVVTVCTRVSQEAANTRVCLTVLLGDCIERLSCIHIFRGEVNRLYHIPTCTVYRSIDRR